eukprot:TRINITY_DN19405_c1_g3_i1.p2 TRINITY_DN19405_c1_g3~~TRINITY_DN19405_c1_g3_i1.p2  ORF type:complete len:154 (-),score=12.04 TRINITY_DN19405_c1_g3_i1:489-950(-)
MIRIIVVSCILFLAGVSLQLEVQVGTSSAPVVETQEGISLAPVVEQIEDDDDCYSFQSDDTSSLNPVASQPQQIPLTASFSSRNFGGFVKPAIALFDPAPDLCQTQQSSCSFFQIGSRFTFNSQTNSCSEVRTCTTNGFSTQKECDDSCVENS